MAHSAENRSAGGSVQWEELLPAAFKRRLAACPIVYVPLGLCEPHGQIAAFGLDTIKAVWLCEEAARRTGGIVAPTVGYQIHETGYHARWLEDVVGEVNPHMTAMPPEVMLRFFLYQLRAFANAGFKGIVAVTGHGGGNQFDYRLVAERFARRTGLQVFVASDPELTGGQYEGDHAGRYEISQLLYIRPELVDMEAAPLASVPGAGGRLALGDDYADATPALGKRIMETCAEGLCAAAAKMLDAIKSESVNTAAASAASAGAAEAPPIGYAIMEEIWAELLSSSADWRTTQPDAGQQAVGNRSRWKALERRT
ncbi:creatininase family protein [Cohnella sp. GbtcB17]|uniref:creatininase family protein n=1 Tax=Cohnella sp. GbtcB17 TaxID=2824762 RepID=UPI001C2F7BE9|nr:creatininase family protein [Cohnella sp. GbtcB17]